MSDIEIIRRLRELLQSSTCYGNVGAKTIEKAEKTLGVMFPRSYRIFLAEFGASYGGERFEIAGLGEDEFKTTESSQSPQWSSVVQDTIRARKASKGSLPAGYIEISSNGADLHFYLDTSKVTQDEECPVIALGPGRDNEGYAKSFLSFVAGEA